MGNLAWMAWTVPTGIFFVLLAATLCIMTWLAIAYPEAERVGILRIPTTRGDRLFISLVLAAVIHLLWIGFVGCGCDLPHRLDQVKTSRSGANPDLNCNPDLN